MPHISTYGGSYFSAQPEKEDFGSFEPREAKFQESSTNDELTGTFDALNETTNVRPAKGESTSIIHPQFQEDSKAIIHPQFRTGLISPDQMRPVDSLSETFGDGDPRILGPISGNGVFKPQDIDTKGSVIFGDNHFMPDRGSDSITGEGRRMNIWGNGGASTFEDRVLNGGFDANDFHACPNIKSDLDNNDVVIGVKENIDWTAANGGPGSSYLTAKDTSQSNAYVDEDVDGFMKLGDIRGELQTTDLRSDNRFVIERFEPLAEMNSFGESLNPVFQLGTNSGPGATTFLTGQFDMPTNNIGGSADHGGDDI